jgi:uncharacterized membrane protein
MHAPDESDASPKPPPEATTRSIDERSSESNNPLRRDESVDDGGVGGELVADALALEKVVELLPSDAREGVREALSNPEFVDKLVHCLTVEYRFRGPLPPPSYLQGYEAACPGAADRIISLAEGEAEHRRHMDGRRLDLSGKLATRGQIAAVVICLVLIIFGGVLVYGGKDVSGFVMIGMPLATLAGVFLKYTHGQGEREAEPKKEPKPLKEPKPESAASSRAEAEPIDGE